MNKMKEIWADQDMENIIGNLLRFGVITAGALVLIGGIIYLIRHGSEIPDYRVFRGEPSELTNVHKIIVNALSFHTNAVIQLGFLVLIATPVSRVALSVYGFARQGDRIYIAVTLIVLIILLFSLSGALWG